MLSMWNYKALSRIDFRVIPLILALMSMGLLVIADFSGDTAQTGEDTFLPLW